MKKFTLMKVAIIGICSLLLFGCAKETTTGQTEITPHDFSLLYQGHASLRITTAEGKVIYIDPASGEGYDLPADMILVTHGHPDHNKIDLVTQKEGCVVITEKEALENTGVSTYEYNKGNRLINDGEHNIFEYDFVKVEAVEANNERHDPAECVGYILTLSNGTTLYISGDTSKTEQMKTFADRKLDYAFIVCDGVYNMDVEEASACAKLIGAKHTIPYHMTSQTELFSQEVADKFDVEGKKIMKPGEIMYIYGAVKK